MALSVFFKVGWSAVKSTSFPWGDTPTQQGWERESARVMVREADISAAGIESGPKFVVGKPKWQNSR